MNFICLNGEFVKAEQPVLRFDNRSFRYGYGLFETIRMANGQVPLLDFHIERLNSGLKFLGSEPINPNKIDSAILETARKNNCEKHARVRLTAFNGNGGLFDNQQRFDWIIEASPVDPIALNLNEKGLQSGLCARATKNIDEIANLKSANFLVYAIAAGFAKANSWDEAFVINHQGRIADGTIANVFVIKNKTIITPPLSEGPIAGVMRKWLLQNLPLKGYSVIETPISVEDLESADEIFLTNAISGIRWVAEFNGRSYSNAMVREIYCQFIPTIWA